MIPNPFLLRGGRNQWRTISIWSYIILVPFRVTNTGELDACNFRL